MVIEVARSIPDPQWEEKVAAERKRFEQQGREWPEEIFLNEAQIKERVFQKAAEASWEEYRVYENRILNTDSTNLLQQHLSDPDPMKRLLAKALYDVKTGKISISGTIAELTDDYGNVKNGPKPEIIADNLLRWQGVGVAEYVAVFLVKKTNAPAWRASGLIEFLARVKNPSTTVALIRKAAETRDEMVRQRAITAIQAIQDPELSAKIEAERKRAQEHGVAFPHLNLPEKK